MPVTYLRGFTDQHGYLQVYRKDAPSAAFRQRPEATGFERYYYSQMDDEGTRDDDRLEALFSAVETDWPPIAAGLASRRPRFAKASQLIVFLGLMRVRGPAFRDAVELQLAQMVHMQAKALQRAGQLPPPPAEFPDLLDHVQVAIDPQRSLIAMAETLSGIGEMLGRLSYEVIHNTSAMPFLTSDNPVIYFDPSRPVRSRYPYTIRPGGRVELLFPVSASMLLRGRSIPMHADIRHKDVADARQIVRFNREIARYGYRFVFAPRTGMENIIGANAAVSPVVRFDTVPTPEGGSYHFSQMIFGPRPNKPKW